jgi:Protein of unknown function (DUF3667)
METEAHSDRCLDCGEPLSGQYCASCGQKASERILPLRHVLHEVLHELWHLDSRFLVTVRALAKPGFLTQEYLAGRRTRWFPPFRLYLIASLAMFLVASLRPFKLVEIHVTPGKGEQVATANPPGKSNAPSATPERPPRPWEIELQRRGREIDRDPAPFFARVLAWLPRVLFLLLPLFALLLKWLYIRSGTLYVAHAIFSLHEHAFAFLYIAAANLVGLIPHSGCLKSILFLALPVHLVLALKRLYGQRWPITIVKATTLGVLHGVVTAAILAGTTALLFFFG